MEIGSKIKWLRGKAGLTQEQLAIKLGISAQSVSKWETGVTMPDITLLPLLAGELGVTIDEIFDLTVDQKLHRIERRIDVEEELETDVFREYEAFLKNQLDETKDKPRVLGLLARLYHHRMEADSRRVSKYARESIQLDPAKKDCQWMLQKAEGANCWDWNIANHTSIINFYREVVEKDTITPKSPMPYYELMDNLLADHRTREAEQYLDIYRTLPAHRPFLVPVYRAYIALADYDREKADAIMQAALTEFSEDSGFLFEMAQYCARACRYEEAIQYYERSWSKDEDKKPRYTDPLHGIATIYEILGDSQKAIETYDRMIECIKDEWGYAADDAAVVGVERDKQRLQRK